MTYTIGTNSNGSRRVCGDNNRETRWAERERAIEGVTDSRSMDKGSRFWLSYGTWGI